MSDKPFATGRCLCGKVSYSIASEPLRMAQCHCDYCQRSSGTGHMSIAFFPKDAITIKGETNSHTTDSDNEAEITRHFCPECGSRLFGTNNTMTSIMVQLWGVLTTIHGLNLGRLCITKENPVGTSWMKVYQRLRQCPHHQNKSVRYLLINKKYMDIFFICTTLHQ